MPSDDERRELFDVLEARLGRRGAGLLMSHLPPVGWDDLATRSDLVSVRGEMAELRSELRGEMAELRSELKGEMAELRSELRGEMAELRSELKGEMAELRSELKGEMAELRTELKGETAELRIELHDRMVGLVPRLWAANVATMIGLSGLVFAVASFAR